MKISMSGLFSTGEKENEAPGEGWAARGRLSTRPPGFVTVPHTGTGESITGENYV